MTCFDFGRAQIRTQVDVSLATQRMSTQVDRKSTVYAWNLRLLATYVNLQAHRLATHRKSVRKFISMREYRTENWLQNLFPFALSKVKYKAKQNSAVSGSLNKKYWRLRLCWYVHWSVYFADSAKSTSPSFACICVQAFSVVCLHVVMSQRHVWRRENRGAVQPQINTAVFKWCLPEKKTCPVSNRTTWSFVPKYCRNPDIQDFP